VSLKSNRHVHEASYTIRPHRAAPLSFAEAKGKRVSSATDATLHGAQAFRALSSTERATYMPAPDLIAAPTGEHTRRSCLSHADVTHPGNPYGAVA
jgi:hypothetical protein